MAEGETRRWRIGPTELWVRCLAREWHITQRAGDDPLDGGLEVAVAEAGEPPSAGSGVRVERFVRGRPDRTLRLSPALADRSVVSRPESAFYVLPGDEVQLFVSTPLWLRIDADPPGNPIRELPIFRPSDTWFGPSTREGELCYAMRTHCRLAREDVPLRPHRAVTPAVVRNASSEPLLLERICVPVPSLGLYATAEGMLFTESIEMTRQGDGRSAATVQVQGAPPGDARRLSGPRRPPARGGLVRAFTHWF